MFIGYYKSVNSSKEFYSKKRPNLNFPIQIEYNSDRYLLNKTIQVFSDSQEKNLIDTAKRYGIEYNIEIQSGMDD
jgi:hypothetical protein